MDLDIFWATVCICVCLIAIVAKLEQIADTLEKEE